MEALSSDNSPMSARRESQSKAPSYPRRRAPIACDVCRERKTRCNAERPSCSFCEALNIECVYSKPPRVDRPSKRDTGAGGSSNSMAAVLDRLGRIESTLDSLSNRSAINTVEHPRMPSMGNSRACEGYWPAVHATALSKQSLHNFKIPTLLAFETVSPKFSRWTWDYVQEFFADQLESVSNMSLNLRMPTNPLNLSRPHVLRLQQAFVTNVLRLFPIIDRETCLKHTEFAAHSGHEAPNSSVCFALLTYAVGSCAQDPSLYEVDSGQLPGFPYFARAMLILETLSSPVTDLLVLQCRLIVAFYYLFNVRPLQAHREVSRACQDIILIVRAGLNQTSPEYDESFKRIFWTCWVLENELELFLDVPPCGIRLYETVVALPTSQYDEEGMYNLLAMISLRKLTAAFNELVGYAASPSSSFGSVIANEIFQQLEEWYTHLPFPLKFPLDDSLLFDLRKAHLRCLYFVHKAILLWPNVAVSLGLKHLSDVDAGWVDPQIVNDRASECLTVARTALRAGEEILTEKSVVLHLNLRWYFALAMILLLAYPSSEQVPASELHENRLLIQQFHRTLSQWKVVPFVNPPLAKMEEIMDAKQIL